MMSEKRFTSAIDSNGLKSIFDNEREDCNEPILFNCIGDVDTVVDLLNEQQVTITQQQFQLDMSQKVIKKLKNDIKMILGMSKEEQQELRCYFHILCDINE